MFLTVWHVPGVRRAGLVRGWESPKHGWTLEVSKTAQAALQHFRRLIHLACLGSKILVSIDAGRTVFLTEACGVGLVWLEKKQGNNTPGLPSRPRKKTENETLSIDGFAFW